jgi:hypothetical protein
VSSFLGERIPKNNDPWPKLGEPVFHRHVPAPDPNWVFNACMDPWRSARMIAQGYADVAQLAFERIADTGNRGKNDTAVYAIMFNWRHYLELMLKDLLYLTRALVQNHSGKQVTHHKLSEIWSELRPLLEKLGGTEPENFNKLALIIEEFALYDPDSFAFRYATDKKGNINLQSIPSHLNLQNINERMTEVMRFLNAGWAYYADELRKLEEVDP